MLCHVTSACSRLPQYEKILKLTSDAKLGESCSSAAAEGPALPTWSLPAGGLAAIRLNPLLPAESGDVKATIAVLDFIFSSAAKHNVDGESLSSELQQLGLPKGGTWGGNWGGPIAELPAVGTEQAVQGGAVLILSEPHPLHAVCPRGLFHVFGPSPVAARLGFGCSRAGAGISGCFLCVCCLFSWAEHATGLCRSYEEKQSSLQESLRACSLRRECSFW